MKARIEVEAGVGGCLLISDNYNSDITSLTKHTIGFLEQQLANQDKRRVLIVSSIDGDELAGEMFFQNLKKFIATDSVDEVVFLGDELSSRLKRLTQKKSYSFSTTDEFLHSDIINSFKNSVLLIKVSCSYQPERIKRHLQLLPHDTVFEVNFDAMLHNINYFRSKIKSTTKMMCMVKASAYGCGSIEVALAMQHYGCDYLGVAFVNEGVELRENGIQLPIMVLNPMETSLHHIFKYNLEPEICNFKMLRLVGDYASREGFENYPIHIKFDTGMHRAGFDSDDLNKLMNCLNDYHKELKVVSLFSHLAAADEYGEDFEAFTKLQIERFASITREIENQLGYKTIKHILNSAGIERYWQHQFDMVRLGIGLWGVSIERGHNPLKNVCSLSSKIIQVKNVMAGQTVGYSRRGKIETDSKIALLPIGYADGISRKLGNGVGYMLIGGKKAFIVGNICMDLMMLDITDLQIDDNDKVVVFGQDRPFSQIAKQLDTIPYEILTSISPRVRRVYFTEKVL